MSQFKDAVSVANKIFRTYEHRKPERIVKEMGILIFPAPFKKQKGAYKVVERQPIIFISDNLHPVIREIVFGHELGHHLLHREEALQSGGFHEFNLFDMRENRMEYEANLFAAQLMLPDDEIQEYIYQGYDVQQIARAMRSDINLVAIKIAELNRQGCCFKEQEYRSDFLK